MKWYIIQSTLLCFVLVIQTRRQIRTIEVSRIDGYMTRVDNIVVKQGKIRSCYRLELRLPIQAPKEQQSPLTPAFARRQRPQSFPLTSSALMRETNQRKPNQPLDRQEVQFITITVVANDGVSVDLHRLQDTFLNRRETITRQQYLLVFMRSRRISIITGIWFSAHH